MNSILTNLSKEYKLIELSNSKELNFSEDGKYFLTGTFEENIVINYNLSSNINLTIYEFFNFNNNINVNYSLHLENNAHVNIISFYKTDNTKPVIKVDTILEENAYCNNIKLFTFLGETKYESQVLLNGEHSENNDYNVVINNSGYKQNYEMVVTHNNKSTKSQMRSFAICKGNSIISIDTNGVIKQGMKESNISQKTKGILLSLESGISANPLLLIDEYDCLASHGAGIGAIDEEDLFYLMSRGLTREEGETLIIGGFLNPIYKELPNDDIKEYVKNIVSKYL